MGLRKQKRVVMSMYWLLWLRSTASPCFFFWLFLSALPKLQVSLGSVLVNNLPARIKTNICQQCYSRSDLSLHEDEDEHQQSRQAAGEHHPDGKFTVRAQRIDDPASFVGTRHRETLGDAQFLNRNKDSSEHGCYSDKQATTDPLKPTWVYVSSML